MIHGNGNGAAIEIHNGNLDITGITILQYAAHAGIDFVSTGTDMEPAMWPTCVSAGPGAQVTVRRSFLHSRAGSGAIAAGANARLAVVACEMHGCCFAGAAAFDGGHVHVSSCQAQWSQFHGFCCAGAGSSMVIETSSANDCGLAIPESFRFLYDPTPPL
jgi:hypothetical protein